MWFFGTSSQQISFYRIQLELFLNKTVQNYAFSGILLNVGLHYYPCYSPRRPAETLKTGCVFLNSIQVH